MRLSMYVLGTPAPQGSKRHVGRGILVEASKRVTPWREAVVAQADRAGLARLAISDAVAVRLVFHFPRPKGHHNTKGEVKPSAPHAPTSRTTGDIDKLVRSTLDALVQAHVITDDSLVTDLIASKRYSTPSAPPGAVITITRGM